MDSLGEFQEIHHLFQGMRLNFVTFMHGFWNILLLEEAVVKQMIKYGTIFEEQSSCDMSLNLLLYRVAIISYLEGTHHFIHWSFVRVFHVVRWHIHILSTMNNESRKAKKKYSRISSEVDIAEDICSSDYVRPAPALRRIDCCPNRRIKAQNSHSTCA